MDESIDIVKITAGHRIDLFLPSELLVSAYITEDESLFYISEDGDSIYIPES